MDSRDDGNLPTPDEYCPCYLQVSASLAAEGGNCYIFATDTQTFAQEHLACQASHGKAGRMCTDDAHRANFMTGLGQMDQTCQAALQGATTSGVLPTPDQYCPCYLQVSAAFAEANGACYIVASDNQTFAQEYAACQASSRPLCTDDAHRANFMTGLGQMDTTCQAALQGATTSGVLPTPDQYCPCYLQVNAS